MPEAIPLVEVLLHDLLATTHNLKVCKEQHRKGDYRDCEPTVWCLSSKKRLMFLNYAA